MSAQQVARRSISDKFHQALRVLHSPTICSISIRLNFHGNFLSSKLGSYLVLCQTNTGDPWPSAHATRYSLFCIRLRTIGAAHPMRYDALLVTCDMSHPSWVSNICKCPGAPC